MSSFGNVTLNVGHNQGVITLGDGNTVNLQGLALPAEQLSRLLAAIDSMKPGAQPNPDAQALRAAAGESAAAPPATRTAAVGRWLLKVAPAAAGVAGSLLNPAAGQVAQALADWVAGQIGSSR